jgi:alpha-L-fucosidase
MRQINSFRIFLVIVVFSGLILTLCACAKKEPLSQDERMAWWREAKFGMFIHWGVYSIPAGIWKGREYENVGEWIMASADIPREEYEKLAAQFNPTKYDPAEWVRIAKDAGMKYIVITSKHHDGFSMFDTKANDYNIVDATPYGKDVLKALSQKCKKAGIKFCVYYSILDWHHPAQELDKTKERNEDKYSYNLMKEGWKEEYVKYMKLQLRELINGYEPAVMWFDGDWTDWWTIEDGKKILDFLWRLKPDLIINDRAASDEEKDVFFGDYRSPEQRVPNEGLDYDWETCMTMNDSWGFKKNDHNWKTTQVLVHNLVDIASKGGNLLLNVGPTSEGLIPEPSVERLHAIGEWMKVNSEAIYGTHNWRTYKEGPNDLVTDYYDKDKVRRVNFTAQDIRFTTRNNILYATCLAWPDKEVMIKSLGKKSMPEAKIADVTMLGLDEKLKWTLTEEGLKITSPKAKPCDHAFVFKIVFD